MTYQLRGRNENSNKGRAPGVQPGSFWDNPEKLSQLLKLREQALSARQIAMVLKCTRNTVIGKMSRLGLPSLHWGRGCRARAYDATPERVKRKLRLIPQDGQKRPYTRNSGRINGNSNLSAAKLLTNDARLLRPACGTGKHILELGQHDCRFSTGFNKKGDYIFCAEPTTDGSWCSAHAARVFKVRGVA